MCGIAGLFQRGGRTLHRELLREFAGNMANVISHRGPDGSGVWVDEGARCALSHRRLSIIDTSNAASQPFHSGDGRWQLTFNGEIYNYRDIRAKLERQGCRFRSRSDTEVLIEALALWGPEAIREFDGMFAFAAFDTLTGKLILARDPFGEKPLYYSWLDGTALAFASELRALETLDRFDRTIDVDALAEYLSFQYVGAPRSIYKNAAKLMPATYMIVGPDGSAESVQYFRFQPGLGEPDRRSLAAIADELEDILTRSIERRLIADVPLGAFLSGGVDSSTVCALIAKRLGVPLKTYSIGFEGSPPESEHEVARAFARHIGAEHHEEIISPDVGGFLEHCGRLLDEPNADTSCLPTYYLSRFARRHVTVAISGDGGDELFGGYGRYAWLLKERAKRKAQPFLPDGYWTPGAHYYGPAILISGDDEVEGLLGFFPEGFAHHLARLRAEIDDGSGALLAAMRGGDAAHYMPGAVLAKVDRMSMQHSLEVRTPFLNVELARFAERLPESVLANGEFSKRALREVAYRYLPRDLIDMPKRGFGLPMNAWMRDSLLPMADKLLGGASMLRDKLGAKGVGAFLQRHRDPARFNPYQLWGVVSLEIWLRDRRVVFPDIAKEVRRSTRGIALPQPEIWSVPAGGRTCIAVPGTILGPDADAVTRVPPEVSRMLARDRRRLEFAGAEPVLLTARREGPQESQSAPQVGGAALVLPTLNIARRINPEAYHALAAKGFEKLILPCEFDAGAYQKIALVAERPKRKSSGRLFFESVLEDVRHIARRTRDKILRRKKKPKKRIKHTDEQAIPPLRSVPAIAAEGSIPPMGWELWFSRFADRYLMPTRVVGSLNVGDKIVVFTHGLVSGGAERQWVYLAKGLAELGYDVTFVISGKLEGQNAHYLDLLERTGVEIISASGQPLDAESHEFMRKFPCAFLDMQNIAEVAAVFRALKPKVVFTQLDTTNIGGAAAAFVSDIPGVVMSFRNHNPTHFPQWAPHWPWMEFGYRSLVGSPRIRLTGNFKGANEDYARWLDVPRSTITTIPNAIDTTLFPLATAGQALALRRELKVPEDAPILLGVFRLDLEKGPDVFVRVCARIAECDSKACFVIAGAGPMEDDLRSQVDEAGLAERILFVGPRPDINVLMRAAGLLLHTPRQEGMPNVILEAMLSGTPIVATGVGAIPDLLVDGESARIRPAGDVAGIAECCIELLKDSAAAKRLAERAADAAARQSTPIVMATRYAEVAASLFERESPASAKRERFVLASQ
jgi:asparagine synthase (glutamine-hydrolysing)